MLGKVIVHGPTREAARRALVAALDDTAILGLTTNLGFLRGLADSDAFRDREIDTAWLDRHPDAVRPHGTEVAALLGAWALATEPTTRTPRHPFGTRRRLAAGRADRPRCRSSWSSTARTGSYRVDPAGSVRSGERAWAVHPIAGAGAGAGDVLRLEVDGQVHEAAVRVGPHAVAVALPRPHATFTRPDAVRSRRVRGRLATARVTSPMPGTVLAVHVTEGQQVEEGEVLGVLEAMKMELSLRAPFAGAVTTVAVAAGDQVALGATLFEVAPDAEQEEEQP